MTVSRARKQRGQATERLTAEWFAANGWPYAEAVGAGRNGSDVTGMPGLCVEVKARRSLDLPGFLRQHALDPNPAFVVVRPDGYGPAAIASWGVLMRLDDFTQLLRAAGYGGRGEV